MKIKKITSILLTLFFFLNIYSQKKIELEYVINNFNQFIEISLDIGKPSNKYNLIDFDTIIVKDNHENVLKKSIEHSFEYDYTNGSTKSIRVDVPKEKYEYLNISGVLKYFKPSLNKNSRFEIGKISNLQKNINLVPKSIQEKDSTLYYSIVDSSFIKKKFTSYKYKNKYENDKNYRPIDFNFYNFIYAYRYSDNKKMLGFINDIPSLAIGGNTLILQSENGVIYRLIRLGNEKGILESKLFLVIENNQSITKVPFEFKEVKTE